MFVQVGVFPVSLLRAEECEVGLVCWVNGAEQFANLCMRKKYSSDPRNPCKNGSFLNRPSPCNYEVTVLEGPEVSPNSFRKHVNKAHQLLAAHLLVSKYVNKVEEGERSRLKNQLPGVFGALPGENQKLMSGTVRDHQTNLEIRRSLSWAIPPI